LRTEVAIEETEKKLKKLREMPKKGLVIRNLSSVSSSIASEVSRAGVHSKEEMVLSEGAAEEQIRQIIVLDRKNYDGVITVTLRPGYHEEAKKLLASLDPSPAAVLILFVTNHLKAMGYLYTVEE